MTQLAGAMVNKGIAKEEDKEIIAHGLKTGIQLLSNILTTIIIGLAFGLVVESFIFLISFSFIRTYAGGYHCKNTLNCYFFSSGIVVAVLAIIKYTPTRFIPVITIIMLLVSLSILLKLAPIETCTKPLDEIERKYFRKKAILHLSVECAVIVILFLFQIYNFGYVMSLGVTMSAFMVFLQKQLSHRSL